MTTTFPSFSLATTCFKRCNKRGNHSRNPLPPFVSPSLNMIMAVANEIKGNQQQPRKTIIVMNMTTMKGAARRTVSSKMTFPRATSPANSSCPSTPGHFLVGMALSTVGSRYVTTAHQVPANLTVLHGEERREIFAVSTWTRPVMVRSPATATSP